MIDTEMTYDSESRYRIFYGVRPISNNIGCSKLLGKEFKHYRIVQKRIYPSRIEAPKYEHIWISCGIICYNRKTLDKFAPVSKPNSEHPIPLGEYSTLDEAFRVFVAYQRLLGDMK